MEVYEVGLSDLRQILNDNTLSESVKNALQREKPLLYRKLSAQESESLVKLILQKISDPDLKQAGTEFRENWDLNWQTNLSNFKNSHSVSHLVPAFIPSNEILRFRGEYIFPIIPDFEMRLVRILRQYLFEKYFWDVDELHEFGAGSGFNLIHFGQLYPHKKLFGYDWVHSSVELVSLAGKSNNLQINTAIFDMFKPNYSLEISSRSGLLTVGALEQLGKKWHEFLDFMINKKFSIYVNIETIYEQYLKSPNLYASLAKDYLEKRNWLQGYFQELTNLEEQGVIEIIQQQTVVGSKFHDSWSYTVWRLKNV